MWSPFCAHSPEWIALRAARDGGADARDMDLPPWHAPIAATENRYGDRRAATRRARAPDAYLAKLCGAFRLDDTDTLWDHLFELELAGTLGDARDDAGLARLEARLAVHFDALRFGEPAGDRDGPREAFMLRCFAWAARDAASSGGRVDHGGVVAVCGGWHRPALLEGLAGAIDALEVGASFPEAPPPELPDAAAAANARWGSYHVPYSHKRLDSLAGYASGMPSPGFYGHVWASGAASAAERAMTRIARRLRAKHQPVSTADLIACRATAEALARMRAHAIVARGDLLDAVAATLVKDALDVEVPWARRGVLRKGTDPVLVEVVAELAGDAIGELAKGTPRPPLAADVEAELERLDLTPSTPPREASLDLASAIDLPRSRALHRLRVLGVPGFARAAGPRSERDRETRERWLLARDVDADTRLVRGGRVRRDARVRGARRPRGARVVRRRRARASADTLGDAIAAGLLDFARRRARSPRRVDPHRAVVRRRGRRPCCAACSASSGTARCSSPRATPRSRASRRRRSIVACGSSRASAARPASPAMLDVRGGRRAARRGADANTLRARRRRSRPRAGRVRAARRRRHRAPGDPRRVPRRDRERDARRARRGDGRGARGAPPHAAERARRSPRQACSRSRREEMLAATPTSCAPLDEPARDSRRPTDFLGALPALRFAFGWFPPRERRVIADAAVAAASHGLDRSAALRCSIGVAAPAAIGRGGPHRGAAALATAQRYGCSTDAIDDRARRRA